MSPLRLVTRGSRLALFQSNLVKDTILAAQSDVQVELQIVKTTGDRQGHWSLEQQGGTGLFTKELEQRLLEKEADLAVHSSKDLPAKIVDGLEIAGYLPREAPHDVLILREDVDAPAKIATGSPRRREQLKERFPDVEWIEMRGNVETRLNKIRDGYADGTLLAAAGLNRLEIHEWENLTFHALPIEEVVPAPGQGAIAVQCRAGEAENLPASIFCDVTRRAVDAEKNLMSYLGGGCHSCIGAYLDQDRLLVFHEDTRHYTFPVTTADEAEIAEISAQLRKAAG
jgi:hydroxymethylbilane synthase